LALRLRCQPTAQANDDLKKLLDGRNEVYAVRLINDSP
jgi:hypothetical protein